MTMGGGLGRVVALRHALVLTVLFAGCRCGAPEGDAPARDAGQPPMPTGMLVPVEGSAPVPASSTLADAGPGRRMALTQGETGGAFVELQPSAKGELPDRRDFTRWQKTSHYLSVDAITLLHGPLARANPGFDLFVPRYFGPYALERLVTELATFEKAWAALGSMVAAKETWARQSSFIDGLANEAEWAEAKAGLLATVQKLSALAAAHAKRDEGLWILP